MNDFFDGLNAYFFNPLTGNNRQLYLNCINKMIEESDNSTNMHERDAVSALEWYFRNESVHVSNDAENDVLEENVPKKNATMIIRYFEKCGWMSTKDMDHNGENFATITSSCRFVVSALNHIVEQKNSAARVTNYILQMHDKLDNFQRSKSDNIRHKQPYQLFLVPLMEDMNGCKERLRTYSEQEREVKQFIMTASSVEQLLNFEKQNEMFQAYDKIKKNGAAEYYLAIVLRMMKTILNGQVREDIIQDCQTADHIDNYEEAAKKVDNLINRLISFASFEYQSLIQEIDKRHAEYWQLLTNRLAALTQSESNRRSLNALLIKMKDIDPEERDKLLDRLQETWQLSRIQCMGFDVMRKPKAAIKHTPNIELPNPNYDESELKQQTDDFLNGLNSRFSRRNLRQYIHTKMEGRDEINSQDDVKSWDDTVAFLLQTAMEDDPSEDERVMIKPGLVKTPVGKMSNITFQKVSSKRIKDSGGNNQ